MNWWQRLKVSFRQTSIWNKLYVCFTGLLVVANVFYVHYARKQFQIMNDQLGQMRGSGQQTDRLLGLYEQQIGKLGEQVSKTDELARHTNQLAGETNSLVKIAQATYSDTVRPYVGVWNQTPIHNVKDRIFTINFDIKNFGTIPATDFLADWRCTIDKHIIPASSEIKQDPGTLFPGDYISKVAAARSRDYDLIVSGREILEFEVVANYKGPNHKYNYCGKFRYVSSIDRFISTGTTGCTFKPEHPDTSSDDRVFYNELKDNLRRDAGSQPDVEADFNRLREELRVSPHAANISEATKQQRLAELQRLEDVLLLNATDREKTLRVLDGLRFTDLD
jgi:hypothetical protein